MRFLIVLFALLPVLAWDEPVGDKKVILLEDTEVYQPLQVWEVEVSPKGHVYAINFQESYINHYGPDGTKLANIGSRGKGPGEFGYIVDLFFLNGKLYALDMLDGQMSIFSEDGKFEKRMKLPERGLKLARMSNGWLYGDWASWFGDHNGKLYMVGEDFTQPKTLVEMKEKTMNRGTYSMSNDGEVKAFHNPITTHPYLVGSPDGKKAYLTDSWALKIHIFDEKGNKRTIDRKEKRIPFDMEWAQEGLREANERGKKEGTVYKLQAPEYFPVIRSIKVGPEGNLIIDRWRGRPDDNHHPIALNDKGEEVPMKYDWDVVDRMFGVANGHIYLSIFNHETEQGGVARVKLEDANAWAKANPLDYEGDIGHSIDISN